MLLAIDVGNSNTVFGVYDDQLLLAEWRLSTDGDRTVDEFGVLLRNLFSIRGLDPSQIEGVIAASVVPRLDWKIADMTHRYFDAEAVFVTHENVGIRILYKDPSEIGADRLVDAVAVIDRYSVPAIFVDLGTVTTFNAVNGEGAYQGGLVAPGVELSAAALVERAAKLPRFDIRKPEVLIGQTTVESMQSGFFWGYVSLVDGILARMREELGEDTSVIGTGGMARYIEGESAYVTTIDTDLTLRGLRLVASRLGVA